MDDSLPGCRKTGNLQKEHEPHITLNSQRDAEGPQTVRTVSERFQSCGDSRDLQDPAHGTRSPSTVGFKEKNTPEWRGSVSTSHPTPHVRARTFVQHGVGWDHFARGKAKMQGGERWVRVVFSPDQGRTAPNKRNKKLVRPGLMYRLLIKISVNMYDEVLQSKWHHNVFQSRICPSASQLPLYKEPGILGLWC